MTNVVTEYRDERDEETKGKIITWKGNGGEKKNIWQRLDKKRENELESRPKVNKAVYTAASVACFWAGAVTLLTTSKAETALSYQFG